MRQELLKNAHNVSLYTLDETERIQHRVLGLIPAGVDNMHNQVIRCEKYLASIENPTQRNVFLANLRTSNVKLYEIVVKRNLSALLPIIYTPVIGDICLNNHYLINIMNPEGMFVSQTDIEKNRLMEVFQNYSVYHSINDADIIVVTDGSRILGLGDLGVNGVGITIGKSSLYIVAANMDSKRIIPAVIDVGTNNKTLLNDPLYLGLKKPRVKGEDYYLLLDEFMSAVHTRWPKALIHFEDFSLNNCFNILERYHKKYLCFNDDIQGTGVVATSAYLNCLKILKESPLNCKILFLGAGTAAMGIALRMIHAVSRLNPEITPDMLREKIFMYDIDGVIINTQPKKLTYTEITDTPVEQDMYNLYREYFSRHEKHYHELSTKDLAKVVQAINPTFTLALTGCSGLLSDDILRNIKVSQPVVFILSNPTSNMECTAASVLNIHKNAIFAGGSPQPAMNGFQPSQVNNLYVFPGIGMGSYLSQAKYVTENCLTSAAFALQNLVSDEDLNHRRILPDLANLNKITNTVASAVVMQLIDDGVTNIKVSKDECSMFIESFDFHKCH